MTMIQRIKELDRLNLLSQRMFDLARDAKVESAQEYYCEWGRKVWRDYERLRDSDNGMATKRRSRS